jgi:hypothetical protein
VNLMATFSNTLLAVCLWWIVLLLSPLWLAPLEALGDRHPRSETVAGILWLAYGVTGWSIVALWVWSMWLICPLRRV